MRRSAASAVGSTLAEALEKMGKFTGAAFLYIVRSRRNRLRNEDEGRLATERMNFALLNPPVQSLTP